MAATMRTVRVRQQRVEDELHPELRARVRAALAECENSFVYWTGHRNERDQANAFAAGYSQARWGQSPHNLKPSLAVDVVLNPEVVMVNAHPSDSDYPHLWDKTSLDAQAAWAMLERAALKHHLVRVTLKRGRDLPHMELPGWAQMARMMRDRKRPL